MKRRTVSTMIASVALAVLFASVSSAAFLGTPGDGVSDFVYDSRSGEVVVDPDGEPVGAFQIRSESGIFVGQDAQLPAGLFPSDTDNEIGIGNINAPTTDIIPLGLVAPPSLPLDFLLQDITTARGSGGLGTPNREFGLVYIVPEPVSVTLLGLALAGFGLMRRRDG